MKPNRFRQVLQEGRMPLGHMLWEFGTRGIAEIVASTGVDFILVDMEHTSFDSERISDLMGWFKATDVAPFVRVPQRMYHFIARTLDAGALGIMMPNVESADEAREIIRAAKYAPLGARGVGLGGAHTGYLTPDPLAYFQESNTNTTIICQIESAAGIRNAEQIAAVEGVDVLWVGHYDLTQSMGIAGQFGSSQFHDALRTVVAAARAHGKAAGIQPGSMEQAREWMALGFNVISWRNDITTYRLALEDGIHQLRALAKPAGA